MTSEPVAEAVPLVGVLSNYTIYTKPACTQSDQTKAAPAIALSVDSSVVLARRLFLPPLDPALALNGVEAVLLPYTHFSILFA